MRYAAVEPAEANQVLRTQDLEEAAELVRRVYVPHELQSRHGTTLKFALDSSGSPRLTVGRLRYGAAVQLVVPPMTTAYHMNLPVRGMLLVRQGDREETGQPNQRAVMFDPTRPHSAAWAADTALYAVKLPVAALQAHAGALLGHPVDGAVVFSLGFEVASPAGRGLVSAVTYLRKEIAREGGIAASPILRGQLESYVLTQVLMAVPNNLTNALAEPGRRPKRAHVAAAIDYIHSHADDPLTLAELAAVAGVSARALQSGFQEELGTSPTCYLRQVRLDRAHADLQEAEQGDSVSAIAARWGFTHLGRFSEHYKRRYGAVPSAVMRESVRNTAAAAPSR